MAKVAPPEELAKVDHTPPKKGWMDMPVELKEGRWCYGSKPKDHEVVGFCFTPQDGNSLASSFSAVTWFLYPDDHDERAEALRPFLFQEV